MKRILSVILSLAILLSASVICFGAVTYNPTEAYTVSADTPTCEEAIIACGGDLENTQRVYFQLPAEDPEHPEYDWTNHYNSTDLGLNYCQVCVFWWYGTGSEWPDGTKAKWVGYRAKLVDAQNRIYEAVLPASGVPNIVWNNGVNGGEDPTQDIFKYSHSLEDANIEGALPEDYETLPEGSPDPDSMDGCIQISRIRDDISVLPTGDVRSSEWYVYYGDGCYGNYPTNSPSYRGKHASCLNPEHDHSADTYMIGDADADRDISVLDATVIQRVISEIAVYSCDEQAADVDGKGLDITDATLIQRYLSDMDVPYPIGEFAEKGKSV